MNYIAVIPSVIDVTIVGIKQDMSALHPMNADQEQFFDYMVGKTRTRPSIPLVQQLQVADDFMHAVDGFPIARMFDEVRFPAFKIAISVRSMRKQFPAQVNRVNPQLQRAVRKGRRVARRR